MRARLQNGFGILLILSVFGYSFLSTLSRKLFLESLITYTLLFAASYGLYWISKKASRAKIILFPSWLGAWVKEPPKIVAWLLAGIGLRFILLWVTPWLSQDFFRFIWDGHMLLNGLNPYVYLPDDLISTGVDFIPNANFLHASMGSLSSGHFTNYPPLNQLFFAVSAYLGGDSMTMTVVWMRILIILADVLAFIYGLKLLRLLGKPEELILLYFFNPFVIVELTGNLHWEGMMASLMLVGVYHIICYDRLRAGTFIGLGILLKLLPVMILPLLVRARKWRWIAVFYAITAMVVILGFAPFVSQDLVSKYSESVGLWFGTFEFNASLYYLIRAVGYEITGYNVIGTVGKVLPLITIAIIVLLSLIRKNRFPEVFIGSIVFVFTAYLFLSTTVHPWYLTIPLLFSIFTRYSYVVVWSFLVFLSYAAYSHPDFKENLWLVFLEYFAVIVVLVVEIFTKKSLSSYLTTAKLST